MSETAGCTPMRGTSSATSPATAWSYWISSWAANAAIVSGIGALNGWTLVTAEVSRAPADDGLFPRPFGWTDRNGSAWFSIVIAAVLPSLLMLWRYTASTGLTVFTYLVDLCRFVEATGGMAAIGRLDDAEALLEGKAGTIVVPGS
jgi:basic amino acid/polyamine antiporter, APA family